METKIYRGWLCHGAVQLSVILDEDGVPPGDRGALYLLEIPNVWNYESPLSEILKEQIGKRKVSVRYWITKVECAPRAAKEAFIRSLFGKMDAEYDSHYGDITGFLYANEHLKIGGHNLLEELKTHDGKWLILEVDIHS